MHSLVPPGASAELPAENEAAYRWRARRVERRIEATASWRYMSYIHDRSQLPNPNLIGLAARSHCRAQPTAEQGSV